MKLLEPPLQLIRFCRFVAKNFSADNCSYRAAALTFTTLLSLVPLIAVSLAIIAAFPISKTVSAQLQNFIFNNLVPTSSAVIQNYLNQFAQQATHLSVISSLFLLTTAIMLLYTIQQALNEIWHVRAPRHGMALLLSYWAVLTLTPLLIGAGFAISAYTLSLPIISQTVQFLGLSKLLFVVTPFLLNIIAFTVLYTAVPNCEIPIRYALISGIIAALLFELAKHSFSLYIRLFPTYELIYGALAAVPIFLIWLYISWVIILIGAEISYGLMFYSPQSPRPPIDGFTHAFRWLGYLWETQQHGYGLSLHDLITRDQDNYQINPQKQLAYLLTANLIQPTIENRYVLSRDFHDLTLAQLYRSLPWQLPAASTVEIYSDAWLQTLKKLLKNFDAITEQELAIPLAKLYSQSLN